MTIKALMQIYDIIDLFKHHRIYVLDNTTLLIFQNSLITHESPFYVFVYVRVCMHVCNLCILALTLLPFNDLDKLFDMVFFDEYVVNALYKISVNIYLIEKVRL